MSQKTQQSAEAGIKGYLGELLVCAAFAELGAYAALSLVPTSADVLLFVGSRVYSIQVKSTYAPTEQKSEKRPQKSRTPKKQHIRTQVFGYANRSKLTYRFVFKKNNKCKYNDVDLIAFVALDTKNIVFMPALDLMAKSYAHKAFGVQSFNAMAESNSAKKVLENLGLFS